jgi:hypothetical protein
LILAALHHYDNILGNPLLVVWSWLLVRCIVKYRLAGIRRGHISWRIIELILAKASLVPFAARLIDG